MNQLICGKAIPPTLLNKIKPLFKNDLPVGVRCQAMLNGDAMARLVVDDREQPSAAMIQEPADRATYLGGKLEVNFLSAALEMLRQEQYLVLGFWKDDPELKTVLEWESIWLLPKLERRATAIDFMRRDPAVDLEPVAQPPAGCHLEAIDLELAQRLNDEWLLAMYGCFEAALLNGLGFCLMREEEVLSQAFAGPFANGVIEIGAGTTEGERGKGYATITCAALIRACESRGYQTFWNTSAQNVASLGLARKLGFRQERAWTALVWDKMRP